MAGVLIDEMRDGGPQEVHARLREALAFPEYYGENLSALSDCLGDVDLPAVIIIRRGVESDRQPWVDGFCRVVRRNALANAAIEYRLEAPHASGIWKGAAMDELRLDLTEDATRQGIRQALFSLLDDREAARIGSLVAGLAESGRHFHDVGEVRDAIAREPLSPRVKDDACAVYQVLAEAEAKVHGCPVESTHFHEVGNAEAVANVLAICLAVESLAPGRIVATDVQVGSGKVQCAHGLLDIPAPATAAILERGIPIHEPRRQGEWCTPTSAALIFHFVDSFEA